MALNKDQILSADDLKTETVAVPEWGGEVVIRVMTGEERDSFETEIVNDEKRTIKNIRARFLARVMCDDAGNRLFSDTDVEALGRKSAAVLDKLFAAAQKLNRLTKDDVEELAKN